MCVCQVSISYPFFFSVWSMCASVLQSHPQIDYILQQFRIDTRTSWEFVFMENFSRSTWALLAWRQALRNPMDKWSNLLLLTCLGVIYQFQVCFIWANFCGISLYPIYCVFMSLKPDTDVKPAGKLVLGPLLVSSLVCLSGRYRISLC